jgi:hypothetical protein
VRSNVWVGVRRQLTRFISHRPRRNCALLQGLSTALLKLNEAITWIGPDKRACVRSNLGSSRFWRQSTRARQRHPGLVIPDCPQRAFDEKHSPAPLEHFPHKLNNLPPTPPKPHHPPAIIKPNMSQSRPIQTPQPVTPQIPRPHRALFNRSSRAVRSPKTLNFAKQSEPNPGQIPSLQNDSESKIAGVYSTVPGIQTESGLRPEVV